MDSTDETDVDLLVVGGGINGAGVARDAAGRGLRVALCEKDDLAQGTSSRSGKYIHGGLRYLEYHEYRLVREALIEREVMLAIAPHLTRPLQLLLPHVPALRPRWMLRAGLWLYDNLGRFSAAGRGRVPRSRAVNLRDDPIGAALDPSLRHGFAYWDVWVDDARLVVLNAVDAAARGARIMTHCELVGASASPGGWACELQHRDGSRTQLHAKALCNTAGPWVETVIGRIDGAHSQRHIRLVKGSHLILKRWWDSDNGFALQSDDGRLIFVNPYRDGLALVGTTDIPYEGTPETVAVDEDEVAYLLAIINRYFSLELRPDDVIDRYAGVRPLFDDDSSKSASAVTRDYELDLCRVHEGGALLNAFGGKLTTYRKLAEHALDKLGPHLPGMGGAWTATAPLPGGQWQGDTADRLERLRATHPWLPDALARHLVESYGSDAPALLADATSLDALGPHFGGQFHAAEARWMHEHEWAVDTDDYLWRRSKHGMDLDPGQRQAFEQWRQRAFEPTHRSARHA